MIQELETQAHSGSLKRQRALELIKMLDHSLRDERENFQL